MVSKLCKKIINRKLNTLIRKLRNIIRISKKYIGTLDSYGLNIKELVEM